MAAVNKNFIVKNGLEVDSPLIVANSDTNKVGIGTTIADYKLHVNGGIGATDLYVSGITTTNALYVGSNQVVSSARQLQNIASLDATTTATIETAIANAPNTFTDLQVSGISTFVGFSTFNDYVDIQDGLRVSGVSTFVGFSTFNDYVDIQDGLRVSGVSTFAGITTVTGDTLFSKQLNISGASTFNSDATFVDNASLYFGNGADLKIVHNGSHSFIQEQGDGNLYVESNSGNIYLRVDAQENGLTVNQNGSIELYYDNSKKFETLGAGATVTGTLFTNQLSSSGIVTGSSFRPSSGYYQSPNGTNSFYVYDGTGNVAFQGTIGASQVNNASGNKVLGFTGTNDATFENDLTVTRDLQVTRNLNVNGTITVGGTSATLFTTELKVYDPDIILGFRTDGLGQDISTDNTANHGGIAIASTEGYPLITLYDVGIGESNPATYKKFMWFKSGAFSGLNTDAWISNYAIGIGSTQFPIGTRLAAGSVQFTEQDLAVVRNVSASGIVTATSFKGSAQVGVSTDGVYIGLTTQFNFVGSGITITPAYDATSGITTLTFIGGGGGGGGGTPGGADTQIQYNSGGAFAGSSNLTFNGSTVNVGSATTINGTGIVATAITATTFTGSLSGNATSATSATTATNATNINISATTSSDTTTSLVLVGDQATGNQSPFIDSGLTYDANADTLTAGTFSGSGGSLTALNASNISTGTLADDYGGTGQSTYTTGDILYASATNTLAKRAVGAASSVLTVIDGVPQWAAPSGGSGSSDGTAFNTGITTSIYQGLTGVGSTIVTLPGTSGKEYIIYSIHASNVAAGNTEVNVIGAFDFNGGERSYFAYNIPVPTGGAVELLRQPQILNPLDKIIMRATDYNRAGTDSGVEISIAYQEKTSTAYFGVGVGTVGIAVTTPVGVYTSTTYPSVIQSIRLVNRTDTGGYPVSVTVTSGVTTTYLVDDLIVPKYSSVEILDNPKSIPINAVISVAVDQVETIDVQVSGIKVV